MTSSILLDNTKQVTVREFREFVNQTSYLTDCERCGGGWVPSTAQRWVRKPDASWDNPYRPQEECDPVVLVSGFDAIFFANWKSSREGLLPAYTILRAEGRYSVECDNAASGYRLPSEPDCEHMYEALASQPSARLRHLQRKLSAASGRSAAALLYWCWEDAALGAADQQQGQILRSNGTPKLCPQNICEPEGTSSDVLKEHGPSSTSSIISFRLSKGNPTINLEAR